MQNYDQLYYDTSEYYLLLTITKNGNNKYMYDKIYILGSVILNTKYRYMYLPNI